MFCSSPDLDKDDFSSCNTKLIISVAFFNKAGKHLIFFIAFFCTWKLDLILRNGKELQVIIQINPNRPQQNVKTTTDGHIHVNTDTYCTCSPR